MVSPAGIAFIIDNEGFAPMPAPDGEGRLAVGHGHNYAIGAEDWSAGITLPEAQTVFLADIATKVTPYLHLLPADATQGQIDACADFCFNEGSGALEKLLSHGWTNVPEQMLRWDYSQGAPSEALESRRLRERAMFLGAAV